MHSSAIAKIADAIRKVALAAEDPGTGTSYGFRMHDDVCYSLPPDANALYNEQVARILNHTGFSSKFSEKYLTSKLNKILAVALTDHESDIERPLKDLIDECKAFNNEVTVYIAVDGIRCTKSVEIGNVFFNPGNDSQVNNIVDQTTTIISTAKNNEETKSYAKATMSAVIDKEFRGACFVTYTVNAEQDRAFERAEVEAELPIDLLRMASKYIYPIKEDIRIGIRGDYPTTSTTGLVLSQQGFSTHSRSCGSTLCFELNESTLLKMQELGLFGLAQRHKAEQLSDLDKILLRSIHWLSVALTQSEPETALITLIVSLETLFKQEGGNSITGTVAESTAFVLTDKPDGRRRIAKSIREFYGKRSAVAHGGKKPISESDVALLTQFVCATILTILNNLPHLRSQAELMAWIDSIKFGDAITYGTSNTQQQ